MTVTAKEEKKLEIFVKNYLQVYEEFIAGYKQYKLKKISQSGKSVTAKQGE